MPEDVRAQAVRPEARRHHAGLGHEGDKVVARSEGHRVSVGQPPLPTIVGDQPGIPACAVIRNIS